MTGTRSDPLAFLGEELDELRRERLYRPLRIMSSAQGPIVSIDERRCVSLSSNDYLGLTHHPRLREAAMAAVRDFGVGSGAVRTIAGTMTMHEELEAALARFKGTEAVLTFQSGFTANLGTISALVGKEDVIFSDRLNHASIIDGVRLCKAQRLRYEHNNMDDLEAKLKESQHVRSRVIVTDGSFSMDGTIAQLDKICDLADQSAPLPVDPGVDAENLADSLFCEECSAPLEAACPSCGTAARMLRPAVST
jgi:glycine C-acetyltransferase